MISTSFILASLASLAVATTISPQVLHERRTATPDGWVKRSRHASDAVLPLRFGLAQSNMDKIDQYLLDVSDPDSPNYGNHWSAADVAKTFAPSQETVDVVSDWLKTSGVHPERIKVAPGKIWLELNATVAEAEKLLSTQYNVYEHASGAAHVGCDSYHVPAHVARHIEVVTPSVSFDRRLVGRDGPGRPKAAAIGQPGAGVAFPKDAGVIHNLIDQLENCDSHITPLCLRALYGIVYEPLAAHKNSYGIVEYTPQAYLQEDLDLFFTNFSKSTVGTKPKLVSIDGGVAQTTDKGFATNGESDLDIEYGQVLVTKKLPITLYQVGDLVQGASFNNLLDALDGSYCTFEGGDDPTQDGIYPDPFGTAEDGAYQGNDCGKYKPAYTISTSYAYDEADLSPAYAARQCAEYAKLGLMGTTVVYSSGDNGVAGNQDVCLEDDGTQSPTGKRFNPSFPGTCPYITSIGATQLPAGKKIGDPESATYEVIFSGGGFSNYFARPAYQSAQVSAYLKNYTPTYSTPTTYNNTGRGFPDISANGANYVVAVDGGFSRVFGTSASAPVVGAMLTNINDARLAIGKKPLGFINPALYSPSFKSAYNDITNGTNPGCGTEGFNATQGWDPVTGLGTPRFPVLLAKFLLI